MNEIILVASVVVYFSATLIAEKLFGKAGLYAWIAIASILMNVEVCKTVEAFGMEMTLGNVLVSSTFLVTDILNEKYGAGSAKKAARIGIMAVLSFLVATQIAIAFTPSASDFASESMATMYAQIPRFCIASVIVYVIMQISDVYLYRGIWNLTTKMCGDRKKFLWLRNNGSTIVSQFINAFLYSFLAFYGVYELQTVVSIFLSQWALCTIFALFDTPFVYASRKIKPIENKEKALEQ